MYEDAQLHVYAPDVGGMHDVTVAGFMLKILQKNKKYCHGTRAATVVAARTQ